MADTQAALMERARAPARILLLRLLETPNAFKPAAINEALVAFAQFEREAAAAEARRAAIDECVKVATAAQVSHPGAIWQQACGYVKERIRALASPLAP